jgi:hypothetical protein
VSGRLGALGGANRVAVAACAVWALLVLSYAAGYFGGAGGGQARGTAALDAVFFLIALLLPMGLVALAAWLAAELARQREAVAMLTAAAGPLAEAFSSAQGSVQPAPALPPAEIGRAVEAALRAPLGELGSALQDLRAGQQRLEAALGAIATAQRAGAGAATAPAPPAQPAPPPRRTATKPPRARPEPATAQAALPIDAPEPAEALGWDDLVRALDFPRDAEDDAGFAALRRALRHRSLAQMLQAAEDVMNLLSQEGIYMDDLLHVPSPPETWRAFISGQRGGEVDAVGGIRDERALAAVRGLMKSDPIFRDTALFFQRRFDVILSEFARDASDDALMALADTRSGRAFMLCARVSGSFD